MLKPKRRANGHIRRNPTGGVSPLIASLAPQAISSMPVMDAIRPQLHAGTEAKGRAARTTTAMRDQKIIVFRTRFR